MRGLTSRVVLSIEPPPPRPPSVCLYLSLQLHLASLTVAIMRFVGHTDTTRAPHVRSHVRLRDITAHFTNFYSQNAMHVQ